MDFNMIDRELDFLAAQAHTGHIPEIRKLTPAQMAALATSLGRKNNVRIEFGNSSTAATNGKTIILPLTNKDNSWIVRGYLDHEIGHIRLTNFGLIPQGSPFEKSLWNVLEDVRIEALMPLHYPGMATNYRTLVRELRKSQPGFFEIDGNAPPEAVVLTYISLTLRALYLRQAELADLARKARQLFVSTFGSALERKLFLMISKVGDATTPEDLLLLVSEIMTLLGKHATDPPELQDSEPDDNTGDLGPERSRTNSDGDLDEQDCVSDDGAIDNTTPESGSDKTATDTQNHDTTNGGALECNAPDDGQACASDNGNLKNTGTANGNLPDTVQPKPKPEEIQAAIKQALATDDEHQDFGQQLRQLVTDMSCQNHGIAVCIQRPTLAAKGYRPRAIKASSAVVARLSSRLRGLLQAQDLKRGQPAMAGQRINRQRLHRIRLGEPRLFLKKHPEKAVNTAIHLLVDNSASMGENLRFSKTRDVVVALTKVLSPLQGVNLGITIFPAFWPYNNAAAIPVAPVLQHGLRPGKDIFYAPAPKGQTPLAESLRYVVSIMTGLNEPRKIIVVITDGEPDSNDEARESVLEATSLGIEVVALGIEQLMYPDIFPHFQIVQSIDDLPEKTFCLLEQLLTGR